MLEHGNGTGQVSDICSRAPGDYPGGFFLGLNVDRAYTHGSTDENHAGAGRNPSVGMTRIGGHTVARACGRLSGAPAEPPSTYQAMTIRELPITMFVAPVAAAIARAILAPPTLDGSIGLA